MRLCPRWPNIPTRAEANTQPWAEQRQDRQSGAPFFIDIPALFVHLAVLPGQLREQLPRHVHSKSSSNCFACNRTRFAGGARGVGEISSPAMLKSCKDFRTKCACGRSCGSTRKHWSIKAVTCRKCAQDCWRCTMFNSQLDQVQTLASSGPRLLLHFGMTGVPTVGKHK